VHRQSLAEVGRSLYAGKTWIAANPMLFTVVTLLVLVAVVVIRRMRVSGATHTAQFGWMSEQWLAEHRALHSA
jgi:hypothetical protein